MMATAVGSDELDLSIGEPDDALPMDLVETAVNSLRSGQTGYTPRLGLDELRVAIAHDIAAGTGFEPAVEDVVVTVGGTEAVSVALQAVCGTGDSIVIPNPAWPNYRVVAERHGVSVETYDQGLSGDDFLDLVRIEEALVGGAKLVVVNSPSNPAATVASAAALAALVTLVRRYNAVILSDEAYESVVFAGGRAPSPLADGGDDVTFSARTFSKTFSMTGMRVGSLVSPPAYRTAVAALHGTSVGCAPITGQRVALEALASFGSRGDQLARSYRSRFALAQSILGEWMTVSDLDSLGGFYLWLDARATGRTSTDLVAAIRARGVVVSNGKVFSPDQDAFLRIALTAPEPELSRALEIVRAELA